VHLVEHSTVIQNVLRSDQLSQSYASQRFTSAERNVELAVEELHYKKVAISRFVAEISASQLFKVSALLSLGDGCAAVGVEQVGQCGHLDLILQIQ
jgi:hypothetical protein